MIEQSVNFLLFSRRWKALLIDLSYILLAFFPIFIIIFFPLLIIIEYLFDNYQLGLMVFVIVGLIPYSLMIFVMLNKDFFNSRSIAKRKIGYQLVDQTKGVNASKMQCMIRNITVLIWPIEFFFILITPKRRLGDRIAGTKLIDADKIDPKSIIDDLKCYKKSTEDKKVIMISLIITVIFDLIGLSSIFF